MPDVQEMINRPQLKPIFVALAILMAVGGGWFAWRSFGPSAAVVASSHTTCVCGETGKSFDVALEVGMTFPVQSPYSGKKTGYPAEFCYWSKDGQIMKDPTPVLMNSWLGKPGATFCPTCGRLVVPHNPVPSAKASPPPTREQYRDRSNSDS
jgi:hypothetical protein